MKQKLLLAAWFLVTVSSPGFAAPAPGPSARDAGHLVSKPENGDGAVTRRAFEGRIDAAAIKLLASQPDIEADRIALFDIAWPSDESEARALHDHALLLIGAVSHDPSELPLAKVYLEDANGRRTMLRRLGMMQRQRPVASPGTKVFGQNLVEEFYIVPMAALGSDVDLHCDFAKNRLGFTLGRSLSAPDDFAVGAAPVTPPPFAAIQNIAKREYPDFGIPMMDPGK
jgi:hypothetical protein